MYRIKPKREYLSDSELDTLVSHIIKSNGYVYDDGLDGTLLSKGFQKHGDFLYTSPQNRFAARYPNDASSYIISGPYFGDIELLLDDLELINSIRKKYEKTSNRSLKAILYGTGLSYGSGLSASLLLNTDIWIDFATFGIPLIAGIFACKSDLFVNPKKIAKNANTFSKYAKEYAFGEEALTVILK